MNPIDLVEKGYVPDVLTRAAMRKLMAQRLVDESAGDGEERSRRFNDFLDELRVSPIAVETKAANEQHYEVPAEFFHLHLGPRLKYSCALYTNGNETLAQAEEKMFSLYAERAQLKNGLRILDLGCGWGSLSLWLAEKYPNSQIVGLSNSHGQREFIMRRAKERGFNNLTILTGNIVDFEIPAEQLQYGFDRVMSIEMFEHMKNYGLLLKKVSRWMNADAKLFVHIFVHKLLAYHFEVKDGSDWMSQYFFTGGTMPSENLLLNFQDDVKLQQQWWVSGTHYEKTSNHWLDGMDAKKAEIMNVFRAGYGEKDAVIWFNRWRMFYMAVAELFGYNKGNEWGVAHYLFNKR
ncbi:SAM-dependent methyltransferase [Stenotrophobium rhamnosiphilum]|uniref:SAM-dependent methyltransferase n=1 Tax=Stenotrophobium rhamnosiphilum TaxID=2029166 RepID=A0A2T5MI99_9GAMM|nr:cyclopropane-fatty-acyl-phospholipid synthase family protein [Stenotrophobium rhamnosiphilum]PTU32312.1 SAM-dependent methyltransferase [Stenotrophobium rhamnosiphilum]